MVGQEHIPSDEIAEKVLMEHMRRNPDLLFGLGPTAATMYREGIRFHIRFLVETAAIPSLKLYLDTVEWGKVYLTHLNFRMVDVEENFWLLGEEMRSYLDGNQAIRVAEFIEAAIVRLKEPVAEVVAPKQAETAGSILAKDYLACLVRGERQRAAEMITARIDSGMSIKDIYLNVFQESQLEVGRRWQAGQLTVAQEHYCTSVTQTIMSTLYPVLLARRRVLDDPPTAVVSCAQGELHEMGARMVSDFLELDGWEVHFFGANMPASEILKAVARIQPDVVFLSVTMLFHIRETAELIAEMRKRMPVETPQILVGGYPFKIDDELWRKVGADGSAADAEGAAELAARILGSGQNQE